MRMGAEIEVIEILHPDPNDEDILGKLDNGDQIHMQDKRSRKKGGSKLKQYGRRPLVVHADQWDDWKAAKPDEFSATSRGPLQ